MHMTRSWNQWSREESWLCSHDPSRDRASKAWQSSYPWPLCTSHCSLGLLSPPACIGFDMLWHRDCRLPPIRAHEIYKHDVRQEHAGWYNDHMSTHWIHALYLQIHPSIQHPCPERCILIILCVFLALRFVGPSLGLRCGWGCLDWPMCSKLCKRQSATGVRWRSVPPDATTAVACCGHAMPRAGDEWHFSWHLSGSDLWPVFISSGIDTDIGCWWLLLCTDSTVWWFHRLLLPWAASWAQSWADSFTSIRSSFDLHLVGYQTHFVGWCWVFSQLSCSCRQTAPYYMASDGSLACLMEGPMRIPLDSGCVTLSWNALLQCLQNSEAWGGFTSLCSFCLSSVQAASNIFLSVHRSVYTYIDSIIENEWGPSLVASAISGFKKLWRKEPEIVCSSSDSRDCFRICWVAW